MRRDEDQIPGNQLARLPVSRSTGQPFHTHSLGLAMRLFGISEEDLDTLGLRSVKALTKKRFRKFAFCLHPDSVTCQGHVWSGKDGTKKIDFSELTRAVNIIARLRYIPLTPRNCERVLELQKGYRAQGDIDLGLNDHVI